MRLSGITTSYLSAVCASGCWLDSERVDESTTVVRGGNREYGYRSRFFGGGTTWVPSVHIVTTSLGWWCASNTPCAGYGDHDREFDQFVYDTGVLVASAAGNGNNTDHVDSPAAGLNVLAVGSYSTSTNTIASNSSGRKPPNTKNRKPELSAPGVNVWWDLYPPLIVPCNDWSTCCNGTSCATPLVAGLLADMQEARTWLQLNPPLLKARAIAAARDPIGGDSGAVGEGGIDYLKGVNNVSDFWWSGSNSAFSTWLAPNSTFINVPFTFSKGQSVRIVLAWVTRGDYTYAHRNDPPAIDVDLDLAVYDPSGTCITGSFDSYTGYEIVNFVAATTGQHSIRIWRIWNRDPSNKMWIGMVVNR